MKTLYRILSISLLLVGILFSTTEVIAQDQDSYFTVAGSVKDKLTRKPLEFVTISVVNRNIGTVTNEDGNFTIKIPKSINAEFVEFSHIGYLTFRIPVKGADIAKADVLLTPYANPLNPVIITGWDARYLMQEAVNKIGDNYSSSPSLLTGFYRETVQKRRSFINITEALLEIYKTEYTQATDRDRVQIFKGRKLLSQKSSDTLSIKLMGGPSLSIFVDIVKNPDVLLDKETLSYFTFKMENMTQINGRDQYVVSFQPQIVRPYPLYVGTFYIDKESLAFTRAEFSLDMTDRNKASEMILKKKPLGLRFRPDEVSYVVSYQVRNGKSYLSYIRNELKFKCDWKRKLFATNYVIVSEMVVTDIEEQNVTAITRKAAFNPNHALSDKVMDFYDNDFWGAYNIIEPTESLESAVDKLRKRQ